MNRSRLSGWAAVLALVIGTGTTPARAEETDTITITGTFKMDGVWGTNADLDAVYANGNEHTWTATLHGVTHAHWGAYDSQAITYVYATSFEFQFSGPDAATLNALVGDQLGGSGASLSLINYYGGSVSEWSLFLPSADPDAGVSFYASDYSVSQVGFPVDAYGYPALPSQLFANESYVYVSDGYDGLASYFDTLDVTGSIGPPIPAELSIGDAAVAEGNRGSRQVTLWVTLSNTSTETVTMHYRTVDGTARSVGGKRTKADYDAASGTLTLQPGETWKAITVSIRGDRTRETNETFTVELSDVVGVAVADPVATVTIVDDD